MGQLIDDLLAFSRLGRAALRTQPVEMTPLVQQIIEELRPDADGRRIEFAIGALGSVDVDPALLKHALSNLLATRSSSRATAILPSSRSVATARAAADGSAVYFVKDNGAGST